jgi:hypothetical protein
LGQIQQQFQQHEIYNVYVSYPTTQQQRHGNMASAGCSCSIMPCNTKHSCWCHQLLLVYESALPANLLLLAAHGALTVVLQPLKARCTLRVAVGRECSLNTSASVSAMLLSACLAGQFAVVTMSSLPAAPAGAAEMRVEGCSLLLLLLLLLLLFLPMLQAYNSPPSTIVASGSERTMEASLAAEKPVESDAAARLAASTPIDAAAASTLMR